VYFRTEGINSIIITEKEDQEKEELGKNNNSTNVIVFDITSLPVKKAKETAIKLTEVLHPVVINAKNVQQTLYLLIMFYFSLNRTP
jgi:hypothetical protein